MKMDVFVLCLLKSGSVNQNLWWLRLIVFNQFSHFDVTNPELFTIELDGKTLRNVLINHSILVV